MNDKSNNGASHAHANGAAMIGAGAAAAILGVHRTTINYAVNNGKLKPDDTTESGQLRFYVTTIERYKALRQARKARVGLSARAEDDAGRRARLELLRRLTTEQASGKDASEVCQTAVTSICHMKPDVRLAVVVQHDPTDADPQHTTPIASEGLTAHLLTEVSRVGRTSDFTFREVLASGVTLRCDDTRVATLPTASRWFIEELHILSYCVLALKVRTRTIGLLILHSTQANAFDGVMVPFLEHVAELLATAIIQQHRVSKLRDYIKFAGDLMTRGVEEYAAGGAVTYERLEQMLVDLAKEYCAITNAYTVICTAGPSAPGMVQDKRVRGVAEEASRTRILTVRRWPSSQGQVVCVGTPVRVGADTYAGMAAAWREERDNWLADYELLRVLAGACVLALSGLGRGQPLVDSSHMTGADSGL